MMVPSKIDPSKLSFDGAIDIAQVMEVCELISGVRSRYNVIGIYLANIDSKEMIPKVWTATSAAIKTIYDDVEGVTVGHGTHTLEHAAAGTAYALQRLGIPIIYTASQIPIIGHPGSDGLPNFFNSFKSLGLILPTARSASSTKGCAFDKSSSASAFSPAILSASS